MAESNVPEFDLVLFGATSFVGRLTAEYLAARADEEGLSWAIAGRSETRLAGVRAEIGRPDLPMIVADAHDDAALLAMCRRSRVVVSTVGPYALYGEPLVRSCAQVGTDYCDLTGEVPWIAGMIERYHARAGQSGARIVHCCGFNSLVSDLGVAFLQKQARETLGMPCQHISMRVKTMRGEFSGGTVASMTNMVRELRENPSQRKLLTDPYSLCPPGQRPTTRQRPVMRPVYDRDARAWAAPLIMAAIDERVVHRTNALVESGYGVEFTYNEALLTGRGIVGRGRAYALSAALGAFMASVSFKATRRLLERFVLPAPGQGPGADKREKGCFDICFYGHTADNQTVGASVCGDRDPGYGATSRMLGEAAMCLARDVNDDMPGGFLTPASLMAEPLTKCLERYAGITFVTSE